MIRMHTLNPHGMPHQTAIARRPAVYLCQHCFRSLGTPMNKAQRIALAARHSCPEKLLAQQPAAPLPFN
ncbi:MAG TPA: hypothetical protein VGD59_14270 [Acidisarcina sp.]